MQENEFKLPPFLRQDKEEFEKTHTVYWAVRSPDANRLYGNDSCEFRTNFQRDRDRILHSKAFRRLMYKTQVYMTLEGDHYRNRLSHSLEVSQLARSVATSLGLNVDLVEAIALGHDLGHTPFGHIVEDVLDEILIHKGGFKHNYNGLLVVDLLERPYKVEDRAGYGLNLTNYTRYGILHHTKTKYNLYDEKNNNNDNLMNDKYYSIEAELVEKIDTLAYLCHDLDDAKRMKIFQEMQEHKDVYKGLSKGLEECFNILQIKRVNNLNELRVDYILKAFLKDLGEGTAEQLKKIHSEDDVENRDKFKKHKGKIVKFKNFNDCFEKYRKLMNDYVYKSSLAQQMDTKARFIVDELYKSFSENPNQLPYKTREMYDRTLSGYYSSKEFDRKDGGYILEPDRVICNFIAGMTDRYALELFETMFGGRY